MCGPQAQAPGKILSSIAPPARLPARPPAHRYFPTYSLGAMFATQIYASAKKDIPGLEDKLRAGEFKPLKVRVWTRAAAGRSWWPTSNVPDPGWAPPLACPIRGMAAGKLRI
jgi:hypothetical protein